MTVPATDRRAGPFLGTGVITALPFTFKVFEAADLVVTKADADGLETVLALTTGYTVSLNADQDASPGGTITPVVAPASGETITITSGVTYEQTLDLLGGGSFSPRAIEDAFDRTVMQIQQLAEQNDRTLRAPVSFTGDAQLPGAEANKVIGWNADATALINVDANDLATTVISGTAYTDVFSGNGVTTAFTLSANPGSVNALDIAISGVSQVNGVAFTVSGTTLTFATAPAAGTGNIAVRYVAAVPTGTAASQDVAFTPNESGSSATNVQAWLRKDPVRVSQFPGADPTGVADSTTALQTAIARAASAGKPLHIDGVYRATAALQFATDLHIFGDGTDLSGIISTLTSGVAFEFDNTAGSYDDGSYWHDFFLQGPGTGTAVGMQVEGMVWTNSQVRNVTVRSFGGIGVYIKDCLTANFDNVRSAGNGGDGWVIERSNGLKLRGCMSESNGGKAYNWVNTGTSGEKRAPSMVDCHAEECGQDAIYCDQTYGLRIIDCWIQVKGPGTYGAVTLNNAQGTVLLGNFFTTGGTVTNLIGVQELGALFTRAIANEFNGFAAGRDWIADASSNRAFDLGNYGGGSQGAMSITDSSTIGSTRENPYGSGGSYGYERRANYHSFRRANGTEDVVIDSVGRLYAKTRFGYPVLASAPSSPQSGETYFNDTTKIVQTWDGSAWRSHY